MSGWLQQDLKLPWLQVKSRSCQIFSSGIKPSVVLTCILSSGMVDDLTAAGVPCFGPSAKAAQLESSKSFAKAFMERHGIPTARYGSFTDPQEACSFIRRSVSASNCVKTKGFESRVLNCFVFHFSALQCRLSSSGGEGQRSGGREGSHCCSRSG